MEPGGKSYDLRVLEIVSGSILLKNSVGRGWGGDVGELREGTNYELHLLG